MVEAYILKQRISLPLEAKIVFSMIRIRQWYEFWGGEVYISFSGGRDSTVLLHLARQLYPDIQAVFINTGVEYPEIKDFACSIPGVTVLRPKSSFYQIVEDYGYPLISREQSLYIWEAKNTKSDKLRRIRLEGNKWGRGKISKKHLYLLDAPFKISSKCCDILKKNPASIYEGESNKKPILGSRLQESSMRTISYLRWGCNVYNSHRPRSLPLSIWTDQDIKLYLKTRSLPYCSLYDRGFNRTGCVYCGFGIHLEPQPNRFQRMANTHPKLYQYALDRLGYREVLNYMGIPF